MSSGDPTTDGIQTIGGYTRTISLDRSRSHDYSNAGFYCLGFIRPECSILVNDLVVVT
jgi:hypothetical protein